MTGTVPSTRMAAWLRRIAIGLVLLGLIPGTSDAARPGTIELKGKSGTLGSIAPVSLDGGGSYVAAERVAAVLKGTWTVKGTRGTLSVGSRSAQFTRNQARVVVGGVTLTLDAPARAVGGLDSAGTGCSVCTGGECPWARPTVQASP